MPPRKRPLTSKSATRANKQTRLEACHEPTPPRQLSAETIAAISQAVATAVKQTLQQHTIVQNGPTSSTSSSPHVEFVPDPLVTSGSTDTTVPQDAAAMVTETDTLVEASTSQVIESLTGGVVKLAETSTQSKNPFLSASVPLAQRVPEKVRKKIWAKEYVDLSTLINVQDSDSHYILKFQNTDRNTSVSMVPNVRRQPIRNIEQWTSAFNTFVAI